MGVFDSIFTLSKFLRIPYKYTNLLSRIRSILYYQISRYARIRIFEIYIAIE